MLRSCFVNSLFSTTKKIGVVGSGQMGTGIGIVGNIVGKVHVIMVDNKSAINNSEIFVSKWLNKELDKKKLSDADVSEFKNRLRYTESINDVADCDFLI